MAAEIIEHGPGHGADEPTPLNMRTRPWHLFSGRLNARLDELADTDAWSMDTAEVAETVVELRRGQARLAAAEARVLAQAQRLDVAQHSSATSTAAWLRAELQLTPRQAKEAVALAT